MTATVVSAVRAQAPRDGQSVSSITPTRIPPTMRSTRIATIGLRSSGPSGGMKRRKIRRYGSETSRRKVEDGVEPAVVAGARAEGEDQVDDDVGEDDQRVDADQRPEEVGDVAADASATIIASHHRLHRVVERRADAAVLERREPAGGRAAGRHDLAPDGERVVVAVPRSAWPSRPSSRRRARRATSAGTPALMPASTWASTTSAQYAGAQLIRPIAASICGSVDRHDGPDAAEQLERAAARTRGRRRASRAWHETPLPTSTGGSA